MSILPFLILLSTAASATADELLEITPNTSRCDLLQALNGINERLPAECQPCPGGQCRGHFVEPPVAKRAVLKNINFANNSDLLTSLAEETLANVARAMNAVPGERYHIQGHANRTGGYDYNRQLSARRAEAVVRYLASAGVSADRLVAEGFGYDRPFTDDPTDGINRRVEFVNSREAAP